MEYDPQTFTQTCNLAAWESSSPAGPTKTPLLFIFFNEHVSHEIVNLSHMISMACKATVTRLIDAIDVELRG